MTFCTDMHIIEVRVFPQPLSCYSKSFKFLAPCKPKKLHFAFMSDVITGTISDVITVYK